MKKLNVYVRKEGETIFEELNVSLGAKLVDVLFEIASVDNTFTFDNYYAYGRDMMRLNQHFPYIIKDRTIKWNVDYSDVSVLDFLNTHSIEDETICIEVCNGGFGCYHSDDIAINNKNSMKALQKIQRSWSDGIRGFLSRISFGKLRKIANENKIYIFTMYDALKGLIVHDVSHVAKFFGLTLSESRILLWGFGYHKREMDNYYYADEKKWEQIENCEVEFSTLPFDKDDKKPQIYFWFQERISNVLRRIGDFFSNKADKAKCKYYHTANWVPPTRAENEDAKNTRMGSAVMIAMMALTIMIGIIVMNTFSQINKLETIGENAKENGVEEDITNEDAIANQDNAIKEVDNKALKESEQKRISDEVNNTLQGSLNTRLDFLLGIGGVLVAGIISMFTTLMVIQKSFRVDYHMERIAALPVLSIEMFNKAKEVIWGEGELTSHGKKVIKKDNYVVYGYDQFSQVLKVRNVGKGGAFKIWTVGNFKLHDEICLQSLMQEEYALVITDVDRMKKITLEYYDLYENFYRQEFEILANENNTQFIASPPLLVRRTDRVRYQQ